MKTQNTFYYQRPFQLESGKSLPEFQLFYTTYGKLNKEKSNVIWICHALTGNSDLADWWPGMHGSGNAFDPDKYFIICANALGGCYGSTGPLSVNPKTNVPYFHSFPALTNRDIVGAFDLLREHLEIEQINLVIGASLGGQHAIEWAIQKPAVFKKLVGVGTNAFHSPWGIAFNETQRMAIAQDLTWQLNTQTAGLEGLKTARAIALLSYRNEQTYREKQQELDDLKTDQYKAASYQRYQGEKLAKRFNAFTYWTLSKAMDSHHVGRKRGPVAEVLASVRAHSLFIGITSDLLFPVTEQEYLHQLVPNSELAVIDSVYGHDGFLIETDHLNPILKEFLHANHLNQQVA